MAVQHISADAAPWRRMYILGVACTWLRVLRTPVGVYLQHTYHSQLVPS